MKHTNLVFIKVAGIVAAQAGVPVAKIKSASTLEGSLGLDDLDVVELVMGAEDEFGISIPDPSIPAMKTVQDLVNVVLGLVH